jgi:ribosomal protein S18 acetylase RimI-like enzyme
MGEIPVIVRVEKNELDKCLEVIRASFATVAEDFGFTEDNCPGHSSFMKIDRLERDFAFGNPMYAYVAEGRFVGFVSVRPMEDSCEMKLLSVLPGYRHGGIGRELVEHAKRVTSGEFGKRKMTIGIIEEGSLLKAWYGSLGFRHTGTQKFEHLPFTVGFMEMPLP